MAAKIPASMQPEPHDQRLHDLQAQWHEARAAWKAEGFPDSGKAWHGFSTINLRLVNYLWRKAEATIEADRAKHPKARRNAPVVRNHESTRHLP